MNGKNGMNRENGVNGEIERELEEMLRQNGAALVGFADMTEATSGEWPSGVSIAVTIPKEIVRSISDGPNEKYLKTYYELNAKLDELAVACKEYLQERGYQALAQTVDSVKEFGNYRTWLPHKTVATSAGIGWIGKNALLVTKEYGSAVRITSVVTDAPLKTGKAIRESQCGGCMVCTNACPAGAVSGKLWNSGLDRDEFVDIEACRSKGRGMVKERLGKELTLCGICIAACPYTKRYLCRDV